MVVAGVRARMARITSAKCVGAAVRQVVAVDRGDHHVLQPQLFDRIGDVLRLERIERGRQAGGDIAEGAGPRADLAHDHHGGVLLATSTRRCWGSRPPRRR